MRIRSLTTILAATMVSAAALAGLAVPGCATTKKAQGAAADAYVGSAACQQCHAAEHASWNDSYHSRMVTPREQGILKEAVTKWATDGKTAGPKKGNATGKEYALNDVKYVVGSNWKQRYLVQNEATGGLQLMDKQFNRISGQWEGYGNKNDWNTMCATCHTTGYRITQYDAKNPAATKTEWAELSVGCEACHGPGSKHVATQAKADIWNFPGKSPEAQSRVCGYCHIRVENEQWKSAQGNAREDMPAPTLGQSFKPWDDWTKWYPEHVVIPGVQPEDGLDKTYAGDLKGMFLLDEKAKKDGVYVEAKHHQEYQGFVQSKHYTKAGMSCITCHAPHGMGGKLKKMARDACGSCHDPSFTVDKYMPNTGKTADNLFVKTHTFHKEPRPSSGPGATGAPEYHRYQ